MNGAHTKNLSERFGDAEGLWAALLLGINLLLMLGTKADPSSGDTNFANTVLAERMRWEWMTFIRLVAGLMIIWWMGSLSGRLRLAEKSSGRLSSIALGVGTVWGALWLVSAVFNSAAIAFAANYANPAAARFAGTLAIDTMYIVTPAVTVTLTFATMLVILRFGGFPRWHGHLTFGVCALLFVLGVTDWYGPGQLGLPIMVIGLAWMALTSALLIWTFDVPPLEAAQRRTA
jgi:hypothetical protein